MKLATYRDGSRNGQLVVVSRDLSLAHYATGAAHTLQQALDDWSFIAPQLQDLSLALNRGRAPHPFAFDPAMCLAPLPRASQCLRGAACASHRDTVLAAGLLPSTTPSKVTAHTATTGASRPGRVGGRAQPDLLGLAGDAMQGALQPMPLADEAQGLDFEAGLAAITADIPAASPPARALEGVRLLMLANTWCLRSLQAQELAAWWYHRKTALTWMICWPRPTWRCTGPRRSPKPAFNFGRKTSTPACARLWHWNLICARA